MEPALGASLSGVRIHTDARTDDAARSLDAKAFTRGQNIYFNAGQLRPGTEAGDRLLAHELTHTLQDRALAPYARSPPGRPT